MFFGFKLSESESKNLIPVAMLFILVSFVFIIYSLHLSYAYTVDVFQYESLGDVTSVIYTSILWLLVGVGLISTILILMASIKLMGESIKRKEYGEDFNPVTDSYDFWLERGMEERMLTPTLSLLIKYNSKTKK